MNRSINYLAKIWPIFLILILAWALRIWKIEDFFYFTYDESVPAFVGRRAVLWQHIPLIGGVTPFNFHLGPYFYWFYASLLAVGKLNPIVWGYAGAAIAVITTLLMYKVGETFSGKRVGFAACALWAFSFLANVYDRHLWALYWGPIISLAVLFCLYKIIKGNGKFVYLLALTIGMGIHADPSNLVFLLLTILVWFTYKLPIKKGTIIASVIILLSFTPLVLFDIRHNFSNSKPVLDFIKQGRNSPNLNLSKFRENSLLFPRSFARSVYVFGDNQIAKQYSYCRNYVAEKFNSIPGIIIAIAAIFLVTFVIRNYRKDNQNPGWHLITLLLILYVLGIQLYGTIFRADIFEHYITGLFAAFLIIFAKIVSILPNKLWLVVLAILTAANLGKLTGAQNSMGFKYKRQAIEYTMQTVGDRPFSLDSLSTCWKLNGYRYLFAVFGREPVKSYVDPNFAYLYGTTPVAEKHPETVVAFVVHDFAPETEDFYRRYALLKAHEIKSTVFGNIEVIIMDNSTGWFDKS